MVVRFNARFSVHLVFPDNRPVIPIKIVQKTGSEKQCLKNYPRQDLIERIENQLMTKPGIACSRQKSLTL